MLPGIEYERREAPSGARRSVSEISLEIEAAEPQAGTEIPGQAGNDVEAACPLHRGLRDAVGV